MHTDKHASDADVTKLFEQAADLFGLLSSPLRLRIVSALCHGELNVGQLLERIETTQPNMSQHLAVLHRGGVLLKRREGAQVHYRIGNLGVSTICREICTDFAVRRGLN
jgi:ArsR family transcriptional regulator